MSTLTGKDLNLVKPALTDDHKVTIGTDLPANFQKIDDEFSAHLAETAPHWGLLGIPELEGKKIEVVAGTIRQNPSDRTKWDYVRDENHTPVGVSGDYAIASGSTITISFAKTYSRIITFLVGPDETLANTHNLSVGANVGLSSVNIKASGSITGAHQIYWNGSDWVVMAGTGQSIDARVTYSNGILTIDHDYCPGIGVSISPLATSGLSNTAMIPVIYSVNNTQTRIKFIDMSTGLYRTDSSPQVGMALIFNKTYDGGLLLDGTNGSDKLNLDQGNIWFFGIFEV